MKIVNRKLVSFSGASGTYPTREFSFAPGTAIENNNWEDIAIGVNVLNNMSSSLYIGDIGNNGGGRNNYQIYQFKEPNPEGNSSVVPELQATWKYSYPSSAKVGGSYPNCETMFLLDRNLYIVTKESKPRVYRMPDGFFNDPSKSYTLVQVTNGGQTTVGGGVSNPSFGGFNFDRTRFLLGSHETFFVYDLAKNSLTGDALIRAALLSSGNGPDHKHEVSPLKTNTEGGTFEAGTSNVILGTESKMVFHWPAANIDAQ